MIKPMFRTVTVVVPYYDEENFKRLVAEANQAVQAGADCVVFTSSGATVRSSKLADRHDVSYPDATNTYRDGTGPQHVYPRYGRLHDMSKDCWCQPQEQDGIWVHRSQT